MGGADEAAGIIALGLFRLVVDEPRGVEIGAHAGGAGQPGGVDAGQVHHPHVLVEIVKQRMDRIARRARGVVIEDQPVARVLLDQFARREMVLEIDDHAGWSSAYCGGVLAHVSALVIPGPSEARNPESITTGQRIWIPGSRTSSAPRNDRALNPGYK